MPESRLGKRKRMTLQEYTEKRRKASSAVIASPAPVASALSTASTPPPAPVPASTVNVDSKGVDKVEAKRQAAKASEAPASSPFAEPFPGASTSTSTHVSRASGTTGSPDLGISSTFISVGARSNLTTVPAPIANHGTDNAPAVGVMEFDEYALNSRGLSRPKSSTPYKHLHRSTGWHLSTIGFYPGFHRHIPPWGGRRLRPSGDGMMFFTPARDLLWGEELAGYSEPIRRNPPPWGYRPSVQHVERVQHRGQFPKRHETAQRPESVRCRNRSPERSRRPYQPIHFRNPSTYRCEGTMQATSDLVNELAVRGLPAPKDYSWDELVSILSGNDYEYWTQLLYLEQQALSKLCGYSEVQRGVSDASFKYKDYGDLFSKLGLGKPKEKEEPDSDKQKREKLEHEALDIFRDIAETEHIPISLRAGSSRRYADDVAAKAIAEYRARQITIADFARKQSDKRRKEASPYQTGSTTSSQSKRSTTNSISAVTGTAPSSTSSPQSLGSKRARDGDEAAVSSKKAKTSETPIAIASASKHDASPQKEATTSNLGGSAKDAESLLTIFTRKSKKIGQAASNQPTRTSPLANGRETLTTARKEDPPDQALGGHRTRNGRNTHSTRSIRPVHESRSNKKKLEEEEEEKYIYIDEDDEMADFIVDEDEDEDEKPSRHHKRRKGSGMLARGRNKRLIM